jgi:cell division septum initiation protein DivIVA
MSTAKMNNVKDKTRAQTKEDVPHINALSNQSRYLIEEEIRAKLLEEVRKDIDTIINDIEDVKLRNGKLRHENSKLKSEIEELINNKSIE